ncbi:MAG: zinc dependent phospholipase C family protein [Ruminococcus sp.]|nr:zinc dependent phospholipase C family protein [Ruminococcus sp.]
MKNYLTLAALLGITAAAIRLKPQRAYAWFSPTHKDITKRAIEMFESENKPRLAAFYKEYEDELLRGCVAPDNDGDYDKASGAHYYACANIKGKAVSGKGGYYPNRLGEYSKSARTMLEENYTCALSLYKNNRIDEAMYALGRAIHFVEDMSCPPHTSNIKYHDKPNNAHHAFENHAKTISGKFSPKRFDKRIQKLYSTDSFEEASQKLSSTSNKYASNISNLDPKAFNEAVENLVPFAAQHVFALMIKFYNDCKADNGNYLIDGKAYTIKNEATGEVMTVKEKEISLSKTDSKKEQKLTLELANDGTFSIKTKSGKVLSSKLKGFDSGDDVSTFRFASLGKNRYRITTDYTSFAKTMACGKGGSLVTADFTPDDKKQVWILN